MSLSALEISMANDIEGLTSNETVSQTELRSGTLRNDSTAVSKDIENSTNKDNNVMSYVKSDSVLAAAGGVGGGSVPNGCVHRHSHLEAAVVSHDEWRLPSSSSTDPAVFLGGGSCDKNGEADPDEMRSSVAAVNTSNKLGSIRLSGEKMALAAEEEEDADEVDDAEDRAMIRMVDATKISNDHDLPGVPLDNVDDSLPTTSCTSPPVTPMSPVATCGSPVTTCRSRSTTAPSLTSSSAAASSAAAAKNESSSDSIEYMMYKSEEQMTEIMSLITKDLSEPYSIYTYRYFIHNWPKLCFLALHEGRCIGAIVCKLDSHKKVIKRGYIAMLAVAQEYRKRGIGSHLVIRAIKGMVADGCDEVVLETEITNKAALHLYENLGFVRDKRLFRYYLNGVDALRLKLWLK